jgi:N,N-dimethylformamidase
MVFFETGYGGAVFSTGSIGWMLSAVCFGFDNNVAAITRNVVLRFIDASPFARFDCPDDTAAP